MGALVHFSSLSPPVMELLGKGVWEVWWAWVMDGLDQYCHCSGCHSGGGGWLRGSECGPRLVGHLDILIRVMDPG